MAEQLSALEESSKAAISASSGGSLESSVEKVGTGCCVICQAGFTGVVASV